MELRILTADDIRQALPMDKAIKGMKSAYAQLSAGRADMPLRARLSIPAREGTTIVMPAYLADSDDLAVKIVSVFPQNGAQGLPLIAGMVMVLDAANGRPLALLEGSSLTAIRTGAGSGAATDLLARKEAAIVAIIGSGVQARTQLEAVCAVRKIEEVYVYSADPDQAAAFAAEMAGRGAIPARVEVVDDAERAVRQADIICTATNSPWPVFDGRALQSGAHINAIGSYRPDMQEVDLITIRRSLIVVDSRAAALAEAGDLLIPMAAGEFDESIIHAEIGEIINGDKIGRDRPGEITYFKSVGVAAQDAVAARLALEGAVAQGLGQIVTL
jgi:ornithine cyclodeaminase/alanine dehydrogenase-like protein (mu-crystallin family)